MRCTREPMRKAVTSRTSVSPALLAGETLASRVQRMRGEAKVDGELAADAEIMSIIVNREND